MTYAVDVDVLLEEAWAKTVTLVLLVRTCEDALNCIGEDGRAAERMQCRL